MTQTPRTGRAQLPSMTALLDAAANRPVLSRLPRTVLTDMLRKAVRNVRQEIKTGDGAGADIDGLVERVLDGAEALVQKRGAPRLRRVINATGIVLHTGLGRSVLSQAARDRIAGVASGYCSIEIDLDTGRRGRRGEFAERLLCELTGAEAAMIVNNNAAATMLALRGLAHGREVVVSRGQLIEIGGSFRLPDVMTAGGVMLREVGTTNKTRLSDFEAALCDQTALLMHAHTSNFRIMGFTDAPEVKDLVDLAHLHGLPMFDDLGSGALLEEDLWTAAGEPTVVNSLAQGADLTAFSGDKLLGGPQAGILLGRRQIIDRLRHDPMARALRIDKLTLAALEATLELYQSPDTFRQSVPTLACLCESAAALRTRAERLVTALSARLPGVDLTIDEDESFAGGGALPAWPLTTVIVTWKPHTGATDVSRRLRLGEPAVLVRIRSDRIVFDLRTIAESECDEIAAATAAAEAGQTPA